MSRELEFLKLLEDFVHHLDELPPVSDHECTSMIMQKICRFLHISRLECMLYDNPNIIRNTAAGGQFIMLYNEGDVDEERCYLVEHTTQEGNRLEMYAYNICGAPEWTKEDLRHLRTLIGILYIYEGRSRVMQIAEHEKFYDEALNMYNLIYFEKRLSELILSGQLIGYYSCKFNIKGLSVINEQLGRDGGTQILKVFLKGIQDMLDPDECLARVGGDNFVIIFHEDKLESIKKYLTGVILPTGRMGIPKLKIAARAGYYIVTANCKKPHDVLDRLNIAFSNTRQDSTLLYSIYDEAAKQKNEDRKWVESQFAKAIEREEFQVYYQPKVNLRTDTLSGAEALCRWKHNGELIPPGRFIPILEKSDKICVLDFYMLEHVCMDIKKWLEKGLAVEKVSVNMSRIHLGNQDLAERIINIVKNCGIPYEYIEIELTETTTDVDFKELKAVVGELSAAGISTAVDDFGMGYSSLNLIRELPWNVLKIDKSFLPEVTDDNREEKEIMLKHVISMAQSLGLECIAEGAETFEQIELLKGNDCYRVQGFYYDKPLPVDAFEQRLCDKHYHVTK